MIDAHLQTDGQNVPTVHSFCAFYVRKEQIKTNGFRNHWQVVTD